MPEAQVNWYGKHVTALIEGATPKALAQVASQVLAQAILNIQANGQIDTGFMANSGYVVTAEGRSNDPLPSGKYQSRKTGELVERHLASEIVNIPAGDAALHFAAEYATYQEVKNSFLYRALEQVVPRAGGIVQALFQKVLQ